MLIFLQDPLNSVQWQCKWVVLPHISALLMSFINLEPWAFSETVRYSIFPWSFGEGWQLTYSFCNLTSLVVMSFLILIKWKGRHITRSLWRQEERPCGTHATYTVIPSTCTVLDQSKSVYVSLPPCLLSAAGRAWIHVEAQAPLRRAADAAGGPTRPGNPRASLFWGTS